MPRIQGLTELYLTNSQQVKSEEGYVFSVTIAFNGVTAGQRCYLRNGSGGAATIAVPFTFGAAQGTITKEWTQGKHFASGIYWDAGPGDAGDNVFIELTYR